MALFDRLCGALECLLLGEERKSGNRNTTSAFDPLPTCMTCQRIAGVR
jgi:hypothetical protein